MTDAIASLTEQVKTRVTSVENGRKYQLKQPGDMTMPDGASIFETTGAWEDYSTPARDFRLLIAIDVVRNFPDRFLRRSDRYALPPGKTAADMKTELQGVLASELAARKLSYTRSDGSQWTLSVKDVVDRALDFEMAYNPNDCVELRWGAPENSEEAATCKRHAPQAQRAKMSGYRAWFHERHWPAHARRLATPCTAGERTLISRHPSQRRYFFLQLAHVRVSLQSKDLRDRCDVAFHPGNATFCEDALKGALHRGDGGANGVVAADDQSDLAKGRDVGEREFRITRGHQDQRHTPPARPGRMTESRRASSACCGSARRRHRLQHRHCRDEALPPDPGRRSALPCAPPQAHRSQPPWPLRSCPGTR